MKRFRSLLMVFVALIFCAPAVLFLVACGSKPPPPPPDNGDYGENGGNGYEPPPPPPVLANARTFVTTGNVPVGSHPGVSATLDLSHDAGVYSDEFMLTVTSNNKDVVIYYTIDGSAPNPARNYFVTRRYETEQVTGRLSSEGILITDRSGHWQDSIMTARHGFEFWHNHATRGPVGNATTLRGTSLRLQGFIDGHPVTNIVTATYIVCPDAAEMFKDFPIIAVTADYDEFVEVYNDLNDGGLNTRHGFYYEYFEHDGDEFSRIFNMIGNTNLGGTWTRGYSQRTFNVRFARDGLDAINPNGGRITHPIFDWMCENGNDSVYRFRLWHSGQNFNRDFSRDVFAQTAAEGLNVPGAAYRRAIKFVNGEFFGFTTIREHTSNREYAITRLGMSERNNSNARNIAMVDYTSWDGFEEQEGGESAVNNLVGQLRYFLDSVDITTDYGMERFFDEFFCKDNFIDYMIVQTYFANLDWPGNNVRMVRAITPLTGGSEFDDGLWRFILHDLDASLAPYAWAGGSHAQRNILRNVIFNRGTSATYAWFLDIFDVFKNPTFLSEFETRAEYVIDNHFQRDALISLYMEITNEIVPLLPMMYNRFLPSEYRAYNVNDALANFYSHRYLVTGFIYHRAYHYRQHLIALVEEVNLL